MERWRGGEVERWRGGEVERWRMEWWRMECGETPFYSIGSVEAH